MAQTKKCVFVGDHHTGKTLICYLGLNREFPRFVLCPSRSNTTVFHFDVVVSFGAEVASQPWQTLFVSPLLWMGPMSLSTCGIQVCMISTTVSVRCAIQGLMSLSSVIQSSCARHVCLCFSHHFLLDSLHSPCLMCVLLWTVNSVSTHWVPELRKHVPSVPIVLVGTIYSKDHLNDNEYEVSVITTKEGQEKAEEIGAQRFIECDLASVDSVMEVLNEACRAALGLPPKREKGCCLQ